MRVRAYSQIATTIGVAASLALGGLADTGRHTVRRGETLSGIAVREHTTVRALAEANGLGNADLIVAGQVLVIPGATATAAATAVHVVAPGETLGRIARRYGTTVAAVAGANNIANPNRVYAGQRLTIPAAAPSSPAPTSVPAPEPAPATTHVVSAGETLAAIASRYGTTVSAMVAANNISNANLVRIGQRLTVPAGAPGGGAAPSPYPGNGNDGRTGLTGTHTVAAGETLAGIAGRYGVGVDALAAANGIAQPYTLYAGARLQLAARTRLPNAMAACPIPGARFANDWGLPRSGGRAHEGNDLMAARGTAVLAPFAGVVSFATGTIGGNQFRLRGDDGTTYLGSHLDAFGTSGRINAGTVIGYVGTTGNAAGGAPHLHFEVHPDNGPAMNPYPVLRAACG